MGHDHERRYKGGSDGLRSAQRLARLEVDRIVMLCLEGIPAKQVVDVGTGAGVFAEAFLARGCAVLGIDPNIVLLGDALRMVTAARFLQAVAEDLPSRNKAFDLAFLCAVLHETDDGVAALGEARRVARYRVAVVEHPYLEEDQGPRLAHRLQRETIIGMSNMAGFTHVAHMTLSHLELYLMTP
ncbi:class I SAM-dependent methyltransferase [Candidatus Fermentibacteria bacterium]|nr:class I SAM-dependent methyltransferase [Candidatus Fermentibacteria bacterium]